MKTFDSGFTLSVIITLIVLSLPVFTLCAAGDQIQGVATAPCVYIPFENTNGSYGPGTGSNPAWRNTANGEQPRIIDRSVSLWPLITVEGIKGRALDLSSMGSGYADILTYDTASGDPNAGVTGLSLSELKSHTITFWIKSKNSATKSVGTTMTYLLKGAVQVYWTSDGKMGTYYWPGLDWKASDANDYESYGEWIFVAITIDSIGGLKLYKGDRTNAPTLVASHAAGSSAASPVNTGSFYLGSRSYVNAVYPEVDIDELRMWANKTDGSGALSSAEITSVWAHDAVLCDDPNFRFIFGDLNYDCVVNMADFAKLALFWLHQENPPIYSYGDLDASGKTDFEDMAVLAGYWLFNASPNLYAFQVDPLDRVFSDTVPVGLNPSIEYHFPKGAKASFSFVVKSDQDVPCSLRTSIIQNQSNYILQGQNNIYEVLFVPVEANNNGDATAVGTIPDPSWHPYFIRMAPFEIAEVLKPSQEINLEAGKQSTIVLEIEIPEDAVSGRYTGRMEFIIGNEIKSVPFEFVVHETSVPQNNFELHIDYWLDATPVNLCRNNPPSWWSSQHWLLLENSGRTLRAFGNDGIITPTIYGNYPLIDITKRTNGTYSFNFTKFDTWAELFFALGFEYLEGAHLCARSDGLPLGLIYGYNQALGYICPIIDRNISLFDWHLFLNSFGQSLYAHLQAKGWTAKYKQHIMDEPGSASILASAYSVIKAAMPNVQTLDAIHSWGQNPANFSPYTDNFIFYIDLIDDNQSLVQQRLAQGKTNWAYYFSQPYPPKPHPTMDAYLTECRLYPLLCYKYKATGMIFWAANQYRGANPYTSSIGPLPGGSQNPGHPPGDNWTFYPTDQGLIGSMRMLILREGLLDHQLLTMLNMTNPAKAQQLLDTLVRSLDDFERFDNLKYHQFRKQLLQELESQ